MEIPSTFLDEVRWYGQIDFDFEDKDVLELVEAVIEQLLYAIAPEGATVEQYWGYKSFQLAIKKQVTEEYEHRGLSADSQRYPLANGVLNIIHQLRLRGPLNG